MIDSMLLLFYNNSLTSTPTIDPNSFLCYYKYNKRWKNSAPSLQEVLNMGAAILDLSRDRLDHVTHFWIFSKRQSIVLFSTLSYIITHKIDHQKKTTFVSFNIGSQLQKPMLLQVLIICQKPVRAGRLQSDKLLANYTLPNDKKPVLTLASWWSSFSPSILSW